ncbi:MAG: phosphonate metabolism protein/1,5-bisphosphokinase (PRPP-forming) PhnN [Actinomycetota bacterium]
MDRLPPAGDGALAYVVGPSGAGKDTVLAGARRRVGPRIRFATRTITRPPSPSERNRSTTREGFEAARLAGAFALWWEANGHRYGIGVEIDDWLADGHVVVVNGSRAQLAAAAARYGSRLHPLLITARPKILAQRLASRGRESDQERADRLTRAGAVGRPDHERLHVIDNSGALEDAVASCTRFLEGLRPPRQVPPGERKG